MRHRWRGLYFVQISTAYKENYSERMRAIPTKHWWNNLRALKDSQKRTHADGYLFSGLWAYQSSSLLERDTHVEEAKSG